MRISNNNAAATNNKNNTATRTGISMSKHLRNMWSNDDLPDFLQVGEEMLPLVIRRHQRARRICLRYNPTSHAISLTLPRHTRVGDGLMFLMQKSEWLVETLRDMPTKKQIKPGVVIPLQGKRVRIKHDADLRRAYIIRDDVLYVSGARDDFAENVTKALRDIASRTLSTIALRYAHRIGRRINRISVRDTRSRWGSCSSTARLSFSYRLIFAPKEVMEYVVAHEVAHLRHMNHSQAFWNCVESICPDHEPAKDWLKLHGKDLYRFNA
jgi:predicted metal-dependent hydrolase